MEGSRAGDAEEDVELFGGKMNVGEKVAERRPLQYSVDIKYDCLDHDFIIPKKRDVNVRLYSFSSSFFFLNFFWMKLLTCLAATSPGGSSRMGNPLAFLMMWEAMRPI